MRKVMLLAAMLAMVLAAAAPVFGQETEIQSEVEQGVESTGVVDDSICSQVYNIAVQQYNAGDQEAEAEAESGTAEAEAEEGSATAASVAEANAANIADAAGIDINTVNVCLNNFATVTPTSTAKTVHAKKTVYAKKTVHAKKTATAKATAHAKKVIWIKGKKYWVVDGKTVTATAEATVTTLPETGGASLLALGAGALLVGGGLIARRIAR